MNIRSLSLLLVILIALLIIAMFVPAPKNISIPTTQVDGVR